MGTPWPVWAMLLDGRKGKGRMDSENHQGLNERDFSKFSGIDIGRGSSSSEEGPAHDMLRGHAQGRGSPSEGDLGDKDVKGREDIPRGYNQQRGPPVEGESDLKLVQPEIFAVPEGEQLGEHIQKIRTVYLHRTALMVPMWVETETNKKYRLQALVDTAVKSTWLGGVL